MKKITSKVNNKQYSAIHLRHSAFFGGEGVKNWPNMLTDSSKKLPTGGG